MTLVYTVIRAALNFLPLHEIPAALGVFLDHLGRSKEKARPKQIELFQRELRPARGPPPAASPVSSSRGRAPCRPLGQRIAGEAWRVMALVYAAIRAALTFISLSEIPAHRGAFLEHLGRAREKTRPKQIERFQQELRRAAPDADG